KHTTFPTRRSSDLPMDDPNDSGIKRIPKMICHVFESEEAQYIAQSIGQAFQVAYMEFLKANGIEDSSFLKEMDYQEVLNSQEIFGNELEMFAKREKQKEARVITGCLPLYCQTNPELCTGYCAKAKG